MCMRVCVYVVCVCVYVLLCIHALYKILNNVAERTPLHLAVHYAHYDIAKKLIEVRHLSSDANTMTTACFKYH